MNFHRDFPVISCPKVRTSAFEKQKRHEKGQVRLPLGRPPSVAGDVQRHQFSPVWSKNHLLYSLIGKSPSISTGHGFHSKLKKPETIRQPILSKFPAFLYVFSLSLSSLLDTAMQHRETRRVFHLWLQWSSSPSTLGTTSF